MLTDDDISALVRDFYETVLARDSAVRLMRDEPLSESERQYRSDYYRELAENSRLDLAKSAFGSVQLITSAMVGKRFGSDAQLDKLDRRRAMSAILQAGIDVAEALHARAEGDFGFEPRDKRLKAALEQPAISASSGRTNVHGTPSSASCDELAEAVGASPQTNAPGRPSISGPTFSVAAEQFREDQLRRKIWEQQTARQARKTFELFCERFGDQPLSAYTRRDAATFKALLEDLPALYGKDPTFKGKTAQQIVDAVRDLDVP
ncbi:MAG: hypothetical protein IH997_14910 [Proteobacteria bacterium]|nr:hypothetical protein [Pseudomonadota bacterium]